MSDLMWTEKYRPKTFDEVIGHKDMIERLRTLVDRKNMPHLLFSGPAGTGKTTISLIIARSLFSDDWKSNFLELNASDERGIDVVRNKVKDFARTKAIGDVPFKIIYLDESDALTREAQQALRRTMENYTKTTRFILSCNLSGKIIDPIQSRCAIFRFRQLSDDEMSLLIDKIALGEKLKIDLDARKQLILASSGDSRRLINILQSCAASSNNIDSKLVSSVASAVSTKSLREVLDLAIVGKFAEARKLLLYRMYESGYSGIDVVKEIQSIAIDLDLPAKSQLRIIELCGEIEFRITEGSDEFIQLEALLASIAILKN